MTTFRRASPRRPAGPRPTRRFALGLLAYAVATVVAFAFVFRYARRIARLYGHDIDNVGLQFGLYFAIYVALMLVGLFLVRRLPLPLSREWQMRLVFLALATLSLVVALYQRRFPPHNLKFVNYLSVGVLGAFAAALGATRREFGLVEVIARPARDLADEVERAHVDLALADAPWDRAKRAIELVLAIGAIVVSLPISVPLAIVLWLQDPGPVLVAKVAVMRGGRSFRQLKLRSMVKAAEASTGPVPAAPDDARVTWLGGLLRRTHVDELPQMINIARGEMSLVGPRPERTIFVHRHLRQVAGYARRHTVRPGLAGMAQVYGDYYSTPAEKLRYDLLYIRRRGPALDLRLFATAVLLALFGIRPRQGRHRRAAAHDGRREARFHKAYEALRGERLADDDSAPTSDDTPGGPA